MPATARPAATTATPASPPRQGDLLATLNNAATMPAARQEAKKLLKLWYPRSYSLWMEHNG